MADLHEVSSSWVDTKLRAARGGSRSALHDKVCAGTYSEKYAMQHANALERMRQISQRKSSALGTTSHSSAKALSRAYRRAYREEIGLNEISKKAMLNYTAAASSADTTHRAMAGMYRSLPATADNEKRAAEHDGKALRRYKGITKVYRRLTKESNHGGEGDRRDLMARYTSRFGAKRPEGEHKPRMTGKQYLLMKKRARVNRTLDRFKEDMGYRLHVQSLQELSPQKVLDYQNRSTKDFNKAKVDGDTHRMYRRSRGFNTSVKRVSARWKKLYNEGLNETSMERLGRATYGSLMRAKQVHRAASDRTADPRAINHSGSAFNAAGQREYDLKNILRSRRDDGNSDYGRQLRKRYFDSAKASRKYQKVQNALSTTVGAPR